MLFSNTSDLKSLTKLDLSSNELTTLQPWPMIRAQAVPGFSVTFEFNKISIFRNDLGWRFKCGEASIWLYLNLNRNRIQRLSDICDGWKFERFADVMCSITSSWYPTMHVTLYDNAFICDCKEFKYFRFFWFVRQTSYIDSAYCAEPKNLLNSRVTSVPLDSLLCGMNESCPHECTCTTQPATLTRNVDCSGTLMSDLPPSLPPINSSSFYRYNLTFSLNNIEYVQYRKYMQQTRYIRFSNSQVESIDEDSWKSFAGMESVDLSGNQLKEFPEMVSSLNLTETSLALGNNPIDCNCKNQWLKSWMASLGSNLRNSDSIICNSPTWLLGKSVLKLNDNDFCSGPPYNLEDILRITIPSFLSILLLLTITAVCVLRRFRVRIHAVLKLHPFDRDECVGEGLTYDVFISSSNDDRTCVIEVLNRLELNHCRVCYHLRDFTPGAPIMENIEENIGASKRVLCFVSANFLHSGYCIEEFLMAYDRDITLKKRRLVVLMIEDVSGLDDQDIPHVLRAYLRLYTYIEHGSGNWLDQLMYAMPINRMGRDFRENQENPMDDGRSNIQQLTFNNI